MKKSVCELSPTRREIFLSSRDYHRVVKGVLSRSIPDQRRYYGGYDCLAWQQSGRSYELFGIERELHVCYNGKEVHLIELAVNS